MNAGGVYSISRVREGRLKERGVYSNNSVTIRYYNNLNDRALADYQAKREVGLVIPAVLHFYKQIQARPQFSERVMRVGRAMTTITNMNCMTNFKIIHL